MIAYRLFLLIVLPAFCFCVGTPPRSPSPVPLDILNFDDYKNAFLEPHHPESGSPQHSSPQGARLQPANPQNGEGLHVQQSISQPSSITKPRSKGGRKRVLPNQERVLTSQERKDRWKAKEKKSKGDPDFEFKQTRKRKVGKQESLALGKASRSSQKRKAASSDSSYSW
ncbi:uncharacterized protein FA14DRAFT_3718 [Meira miltonrushii]|uniref:Uncharacterized protein n=1 Tax=Meira miltonrushii TaxID=1280837 RepID=A0A316VJQ3_9BASI|nr:uncharacterized protein FA14DRAFT_3718 [Meira miltonrushii]PWN36533.1 hypothetical protein FA14DRAFT_3718 [Meira miltonrushii]